MHTESAPKNQGTILLQGFIKIREDGGVIWKRYGQPSEKRKKMWEDNKKSV